MAGDCWIWLSLASHSGLILAARVGKRTDAFLTELLVSTEGKTDCDIWNTDGWKGYQRVLPETIYHQVGKQRTQRLERTNGIIRQQTPKMASATKQVWQSLGANKSNDKVSSQLFQLALGKQSIRDHSSAKGWIDSAEVDLE